MIKATIRGIIRKQSVFNFVSKKQTKKAKPNIIQIKKELLSSQNYLQDFYKERDKMLVDKLKKSQEDQQSKKLNNRILRREFFNDYISITLKLISMTYATAGAELKRSFVDFFNHFTLLFSNQIKKDSPLNKLKNIVIFFPSVLFFFSGSQTIYHITQSIQTGEFASELPPMSLVPIVAYIATIAIESVVIYKNIKDVIFQKEKKKDLTFMQKIKLLFQVKKNPVLIAILTENFITFTSTLIPIICYGMFYAYQNVIWNIMGGYVIGAIQMYFKKILWHKVIYKKCKRYLRLVGKRF